jgi:hypothetical protein
VIRKPTIIVTSLGRTGTRFFSALFQHILPDCTSLHEPDVFPVVFPHQRAGAGYRTTLQRMGEKAQEVGIANLVFRKALGKWSLVELSDARVCGKLGHLEATERLLSQRRSFVASRKGLIYVESNLGYYGLIDVLNDVYEEHKVAYLVRDGREWVRSAMNWGELYSKGRIRSLIAHTWPTALEIDGDPYQFRWDSMSSFERLCWAWARLNGYALETIGLNPHAKVFRFEELFESEDRYEQLAGLVEFATTFPCGALDAMGPLDGWLDRRINASSAGFPAWEAWSAEQKRQFGAICGELMGKLGYEFG